MQISYNSEIQTDHDFLRTKPEKVHMAWIKGIFKPIQYHVNLGDFT
jgi:hypothetical protein